MYEEKTTIFQDWQKVASAIAILQKTPNPFNPTLLSESTVLYKRLSELLFSLNTGEAGEISVLHETMLSGIKGSVLFLKENAQLYYPAKQAAELIVLLNTLAKHADQFLHKRKKILVLSSSFGNGHKVAAEAVFEGLQYCFGKDYDMESIDFLEASNKFMSTTFRVAYDATSKATPEIYRWFFEQTDRTWQVKLLNYLSYPILITKLEEMLKEKKPDLIISTFPIWDFTIKKVWEKFSKENKYVSIVTDSIRVHKSWLTADIDYIIVSNNDTAKTLTDSGVDMDKIQVLGFPLRMSFYEPVSRTNVEDAFHLSPKKKTILYSIGTGGNSADLKSIVYLDKKLDPKEFQFVVVFGKNKLLYEKFEKMKKKKLKCHYSSIGWTDKMHELMEVSDVIITKAGGAIVMEAIEKELPMIITKVLPGQEEGNLTLLRKYGLGILALNDSAILKAIIKQTGARHRKDTAASFKKVKKEKATVAIANFVRCLLDKNGTIVS